MEASIQKNRNIFVVSSSFILLLSSLLTGCIRPPSVQDNSVAYRGFEEPQRVPYRLSVIDDLRQERKTHLLIELEGERSWHPRDLGLEVTTFEAGDEVARYFYSGSQLINKAEDGPYEEGEKVEFTLSFEGAPYSHYQLKLLWGEEYTKAQQASPTRVESPVQEGVAFITERIQLVSADDCQGTGDCEGWYHAIGNLQNSLSYSVDSVVLGVRYLVEVSGGDVQEQGEEQMVTIPELALSAGESRQVKMTVGKGIMTSVASQLRPVIRVVTYSRSK